MIDRVAGTSTEPSALAIVCGGGSLPFAVADAAVRGGRRVVLFALRGWTDPRRVTAYRHYWARLGEFSRLARIATQEGCRDVVIIGSVGRPSFWQLWPDPRVLLLMPKLMRLYRGGDDYLQSGVGRLLEERGFRLLGPQQIAPELLMPEGPIGARTPNARDRADIARGLALLAATSPFDIGQAVVVGDNQVLAVEGPEGTDRMLARVAELRSDQRIRTPANVGVLVKASKIGQDTRLDLPTIGPGTVEGAVNARLAGIALVAGTSVVAELSTVAAAADRAKIFVVGVSADGSMP
jgi:DUF1009 family protein